MKQRISNSSRQGGISLVIVLGSLVFLSALVVAFLVQMTTELKSSKLYAEGTSARLLSQSAINIVTGEIRDATRGVNNGGFPLAWASQPGMIRTYTAEGVPDQFFKLYSDSNLVSGNFTSPDLTGWDVQKAIYTDLNEPVILDDGKHYPILNGDLVTLSVNGESVSTYDQNGDNKPDIEGFDIDLAAPLSTTQDTPNLAPMPVKWLYVLANGQVVAPTPGSNGMTASISGADVSPIIGRIAFWTDDESSKININTASEGTYWDTPKGTSSFEEKLADFQPAQHEYQRYPGHPAMTSLSTVFPNITKEEIYAITPRVRGGADSSMGGTRVGSATLEWGTDRLYATIDELAFLSYPDFPGDTATGKRERNHPTIDKAALDRGKFFLTASSRAPDVNLFNKPRVSLWPLHLIDDPAHRTAFDRTIDFCSTVNGKSYSFRRSDPLSPTVDLPESPVNTDEGLNRNRHLLNYLRYLTETDIPGFGGNFAEKYPSAVPGTPTDRDQILTQIFDYIRSTNLDDATLLKENRYNKYAPTSARDSRENVGQGSVVPIVDADTNTRGFGRYPTIQGATLVMIGCGTKSTPGPLPSPQTSPATAPDAGMGAGLIRTRAWFLINLFTPTMNMIQMRGNFSVRVTGLDGLKWETRSIAGAPQGMQNMGFPATKKIVQQFHTSAARPNYWNVFSIGGSHDIKAMTTYFNYSRPAPWNTVGNQNIWSATNYLPETGEFQFDGGRVKVEILTNPGDIVVQSVELEFPKESFPVPLLAPSVGGTNFRGFENRVNGTGAGGKIGGCYLVKEDVIRSIVPASGDLRLVFPRREIKADDSDYSTFYKPHELYSNASELQAHNLRTEGQQPYYGATGGRLLQLNYLGWKAATGSPPRYTSNDPNTTTGQETLSTTDSSVVPVSQTTDILGDWDTASGYRPDGPYINKPDEGDIRNDAYPSHRPYFGWAQLPILPTLFSPNRMMPSAVMFGSLPSGIWANIPWQTLLFCPNPLLPPNAVHKGAGSPTSGAPYTLPPDHLLLDLFHMPVVEPYAISEPLSTAGRINMNYQIVPFTYINRRTGLHALLEAEKVIAFSDNHAESYKVKTASVFDSPLARFDIDASETSKGFDSRFKKNDIFRSASEICEIGLVPQGSSYEDLKTYWQSHRLTGDNCRERPYATIYPRLTTKSNTFTIHVRAQSLKKARGTAPAEWNELRDQVTGEYRGSQTIERYIDTNDPDIPDYAIPTEDRPISNYYKFRVVSTKQFAP